MTDPNPSVPTEAVAGSLPGSSASVVSAPTVFNVGIGSIADVVFGLALSIGSLILVAKTPQTGYALFQGIYYFGFSFLDVILVWLSFRRLVVVLPYETQATLAVNVALLFCVAVEPFLFFVLASTNTIAEEASMAFAIDIGVMLLLLSVLGYLLLREERNQSHRKLPQAIVDRQGRTLLLHLVVGSTFLVSAFPLFWTVTLAGTAIRYDVWYVALAWVFSVQARWGWAPRAKPDAKTFGLIPASSSGGRAEAR